MQYPVAGIHGALDALPISRLQAAIELLSSQDSSPLEGLSVRYRQPLSAGQEERLRGLPTVDAASMLQAWRRFLRTYLAGFKEPYPADAPVWAFWSEEEEFAWVDLLRAIDLQLGQFAPAFTVLTAMEGHTCLRPEDRENDALTVQGQVPTPGSLAPWVHT